MNDEKLTGIHGWLLLYLEFTVVMLLINHVTVLLTYTLDFEVFNEGFYFYSSYVLEIILYTLVVAFILLKKSFTAKFTIIAEGIAILITLIDFTVDYVDWIDLLLEIPLGVLCICYFMRSKRVKNTFSNRVTRTPEY